MSLSMFDATVPPVARSLTNLATLLEKGAAHCEARKIDPSVLVNSRLFPDMFPLSRQVQIASDIAKFGAARLAGVEAPKFEDTETSFPELIARLHKTVEFLGTLTPGQFVGAEDRSVTWQTRHGPRTMQGLPYLTAFVLPNVYFHATTTYALLRHNGVEVGKQDFLGPLPE
ncbi:MAG: DUF1993 domain-containing protein [Gammaproteobacteria bacterium]|nr:DUF1993 domain-containing protein [Gammaproteobacteria bacterium]